MGDTHEETDVLLGLVVKGWSNKLLGSEAKSFWRLKDAKEVIQVH